MTAASGGPSAVLGRPRSSVIGQAQGRPGAIARAPSSPTITPGEPENLARAKQTLPNGYCGLPLQQTCPHPNACLTCDHFLTTTEFLPQHREQLDRTRELIAAARDEGRERIVTMNESVETNLLRIIDGLQALDHRASDGC